jgi:hypothetical protein
MLVKVFFFGLIFPYSAVNPDGATVIFSVAYTALCVAKILFADEIFSKKTAV